MNRATAQGIDDANVLETYKIARFAEATGVFGNAEYVFAQQAAKQSTAGPLVLPVAEARDIP